MLAVAVCEIIDLYIYIYMYICVYVCMCVCVCVLYVLAVAVCEIIDLACARGRHVDAVEGGTGYVYHIFTCTRTCTRM